jgi:hypothetical protein
MLFTEEQDREMIMKYTELVSLIAVLIKRAIFWVKTRTRPLKVNLRALPTTSFKLASSIGCSSILKMDMTCFSETSVQFQQNTRLNIQEDITHHESI